MRHLHANIRIILFMLMFYAGRFSQIVLTNCFKLIIFILIRLAQVTLLFIYQLFLFQQLKLAQFLFQSMRGNIRLLRY